jgi:hypothetical protein
VTASPSVVKPTAGPWTDAGQLGMARWIVGTDGTQVACSYYGATPEGQANAALIAEAGTVHHETGLTPRQLAEQRQELLEATRMALVELRTYCEHYEDETSQWVARAESVLSAAITKATGGAS